MARLHFTAAQAISTRQSAAAGMISNLQTVHGFDDLVEMHRRWAEVERMLTELAPHFSAVRAVLNQLSTFAKQDDRAA